MKDLACPTVKSITTSMRDAINARKRSKKTQTKGQSPTRSKKTLQKVSHEDSEKLIKLAQNMIYKNHTNLSCNST